MADHPTDVSFETDGLILRPRVLADLEACLEMDLDSEVGRFLYPHGRPSREERRVALQKQMSDDWPPVGGVWVVERAGERKFLGWCGLFPLGESGLIEIGYRYLPEAWGGGIATEAAACVLDHGFRVLKIDPIVAVTHPENAASQRVLTKIGLQPRGLRFHYGLDLAFFELSREVYLRRPTTCR